MQANVLHLYDWSRDGKMLLVASTPDSGSLRDLYTVAAEGDHKLRPLVTTKFRDDHGRFSPDGKFVAYKSNESGRDEIYVQPAIAGTSERWLVSQGGGAMPRWSRDGKELFFFAGPKLMVAAVQTTPKFQAGLPKELFTAELAGRGGSAFVPWDVSPDGKRFILITEEGNAPEPVTVVLNWPSGLRK